VIDLDLLTEAAEKLSSVHDEAEEGPDKIGVLLDLARIDRQEWGLFVLTIVDKARESGANHPFEYGAGVTYGLVLGAVFADLRADLEERERAAKQREKSGTGEG
jgi:hypothetical protein